MHNFKTVEKEGIYSEVIEKSKFIGYCSPVESEEEAAAYVEKIKRLHREATHNVPAYLVGSLMEVQRYSDDGEPQGTAGVPILSMIRNEGITNLVVVVTRYFGGVKLGTGGLVRAYTHMAKKAIEVSGVVEIKWFQEFFFVIAYPLHGKLEQAIETHPYILKGAVEFTDCVTVTVYVIPEDEEKLRAHLIEWTSGQVEIYKGEVIQKPYPVI